MKLSGFAKILKMLYTDKMSIYRYQEVEAEDGTTYIEPQLVAVYSDKNCRISFSSPDNPETTKEDSNPLYLQLKVFCGTDIDVKKGDIVKVQRINDNGVVVAEYEGTTSSPLVYSTHKSFLIVQDGDA